MVFLNFDLSKVPIVSHYILFCFKKIFKWNSKTVFYNETTTKHTPLYEAIEKENVEIVQLLLLQKSINTNIPKILNNKSFYTISKKIIKL